jgi:hypothetical protein
MPEASPKKSIFRDKSIQRYIQNREKSVLPRVVAPPVFAFCWLVLALLVVAGVVIWSGRVPFYITGPGVVLDVSLATNQSGQATAIIFLPASEASHIHSGLPVQVQIGQSGPLLNRTINGVGSHLLSPDQILQQYRLAVAQPSCVVVVALGPNISGSLYAGSFIQGRVQIGSQSLLSLFPGLNELNLQWHF